MLYFLLIVINVDKFNVILSFRKDMKVIRLKPDDRAEVSVSMSTISGHACSDVVRRDDFSAHVADHAAVGGHALTVLTGGKGILLFPSKGSHIVLTEMIEDVRRFRNTGYTWCHPLEI